MRGLPQLVVLFFVLFAVCDGCNEVKEEHFEDFTKARQNHMIEKGWVPDFLPQDAKNISVSGDLDAGTVYGTYASGDTATLHSHCSTANDSLRIPGGGPFAKALKEGETVADLRRKGYEVLSCEDGFYVVYFGAGQIGYYWSVRK